MYAKRHEQKTNELNDINNEKQHTEPFFNYSKRDTSKAEKKIKQSNNQSINR